MGARLGNMAEICGRIDRVTAVSIDIMKGLGCELFAVGLFAVG